MSNIMHILCIRNQCGPWADAEAYALENVADALAVLVGKSGWRRVTLVGYSLGARLALLMATRHPGLFPSAVIVSGTAGIAGENERYARAQRDDELADVLQKGGVVRFIQDWYQQPMWESLRAHPR